MCTLLPSSGRDGSSKLHVCDDCSVDLFDFFIDNDEVFFCLFICWVSMEI